MRKRQITRMQNRYLSTIEFFVCFPSPPKENKKILLNLKNKLNIFYRNWRKDRFLIIFFKLDISENTLKKIFICAVSKHEYKIK